MEPAGRVEGVFGAAGQHVLGRHQAGPDHPRRGLVHPGEDRVVSGPETVEAPGPGLACARLLDHLDVIGVVDQAEFVVGGVAGGPLDDRGAVDQAVGTDEAPGQAHPLEAQRMTGTMVIGRRIVAVGDQFDLAAHLRILHADSVFAQCCVPDDT
jgi:hypothetical protein